MSTFSRTDTSLLGRWWWTIDRWMLAAVILIAAIGAVMTMAASPAVAERIGLDGFYFIRRQFMFLPLALVVMVGASLLSSRGIRRLSLFVFGAAILLMILTLFIGVETKGASRWIQLGGLSLQPSEFIKPSFAVLAAWMLSEQKLDDRFPGYAVSTGLFVLVIGLLLLQPEGGMATVVAGVG